MGRIAFQRRREADGYEGALPFGEPARSAVKVVLGGGFDTVDAGAHLNGVEVDFQNTLLGPHEFNQDGEIGFESFADPAAAGPEEYVLGCLLADGAGATFAFAGPAFIDGFLNLYRVETVVLVKPVVFRCDNCARHPLAHLVERHPLMFPVAFALLLGFGALRIDGADNHQGGNVDGHKAIYRHGEHAAPEKENQQPLQYFSKQSHTASKLVIYSEIKTECRKKFYSTSFLVVNRNKIPRAAEK